MPQTEAAQTRQVSAFPYHDAQWKTQAADLVTGQADAKGQDLAPTFAVADAVVQLAGGQVKGGDHVSYLWSRR
ncbi:hypothetical protein [Salinispora arenicola]|uniref:hypothetical protein n=1 Tax=Salinispora arenicola TaxID=168697 RepID=UPI0003738510|nr:hypothetical protein [Salinispora arenicola]